MHERDVNRRFSVVLIQWFINNSKIAEVSYNNFGYFIYPVDNSYFDKRAARAIEFNFASTLSPLEDNTLGAVAPTRIAP